MSAQLFCFRCGESLTDISLPISRRDTCRACSASLRVCKMCVFFDRDVPKQCREDDAEEVYDKENANFCEWFKPSADAYDSTYADKSRQAKRGLDALFSEDPDEQDGDTSTASAAENLFK